MNKQIKQTASAETEEEYDYNTIPAKYKLPIIDRLALEQSQFDWPDCINEIHVLDLRHLQDIDGSDGDVVWGILVDLNIMAGDGIILYRRGQGFITWIVIDEEAYKASCKEDGLQFEADPHHRKIKNLKRGG
jgi:hypothetical protein